MIFFACLRKAPRVTPVKPLKARVSGDALRNFSKVIFFVIAVARIFEAFKESVTP